jgi:uncharacterized protein (UPF0332 family)
MSTKTELIRYRLARAAESLQEAEQLLQLDHANTFVNRLYYACFYAVLALSVPKDFSSSKHSGVRAFFHKEFVKTGLLEVRLGNLYDRLFDTRQKADYVDLVCLDAVEVSPWLDEAKEFVESVNALIAKEKYLED